MRALYSRGLSCTFVVGILSLAAACSDSGPTTTIPDTMNARDAGSVVVPADSRLGLTCAATADCGTGLVCVPPTGYLGGTGVPHGMCTTPCQDDSVCTPLGGYCAAVPGSPSESWCMLVCSNGVASADKCRGRSDLACSVLYDSQTSSSLGAVCAPFCASDVDCAPRRCDPASQLCVDAPSASPALGAPCDASDANDPCYGHCAYGVCVEFCQYGSTAECGVPSSASAAAPGPGGACVYPVEDNGTTGDLGLCWPLCDGAKDCLDPTLGCDSSTVPYLGHGICSDGSIDAGTIRVDLVDGGSEGGASDAEATDGGSIEPDAGATDADALDDAG